MPQAVGSKLLLYADDTCLIYSDKDTKELKTKLNKDFNSLCNWFIDTKLSIHFREEKTKCILMGTKWHLRKHSESMATRVLGLVNGRHKFLHRTQNFLTYPLCCLLCNAFIQPSYDYACTAWYPSLNKILWKNSKHPRTSVSGIV